MKDARGKDVDACIVVDTKTGARAIATITHAKRLQKEGNKKIIALEGEKDFEKYKTREGK